MTQKQLALHAKTDIMMTSQVARALEKKKLMTRTVNALDRRAIILEPTEKGVKVVNKAIVAVEDVDRQVCWILGRDRYALTNMMKRVAE